MAKSDSDAWKEKIENILEAANNKEAARNAMAILFPKVEKVLSTFIGDTSRDWRDARRNRRLSDEESYRAYFSLGPTTDLWKRSETQALLHDEPRRTVPVALARIDASPAVEVPRLKRLLLDDLIGAFPGTKIFSADWLLQLAENTRYFLQDDQNERAAFSIGNLDRLRMIVTEAMEPMEEKDRSSLFLEVIPQATDLTLLCEVIRSILGDRRPDGASPDRRPNLGFGDAKEQVRESLLTAVRKTVRLRRFWSQARPQVVLWFWWGASLGDEVKRFTSAQMRSAVGVVGLAESCLSTSVSSDRGAYDSINEQSVVKLLDINRLRRNAEALLSSEKIGDEQIFIIKRFLNAVVRRTDD